MQLQNTPKAEALLFINNSTWFMKTAFCVGNSSPTKKKNPEMKRSAFKAMQLQNTQKFRGLEPGKGYLEARMRGDTEAASNPPSDPLPHFWQRLLGI
jgi:hypothetical protein